jgi:tetratricopeptide (TPR) repeat protein
MSVRRLLLLAALASVTALIVWVTRSPAPQGAGSRVAAVAAATSGAGRRAFAAPAERPADVLARESRGLCGTEIPRPGAEAPAGLPPGMHALSVKPSAAALRQALREWGVGPELEGFELGEVVQLLEDRRKPRVHDDDDHEDREDRADRHDHEDDDGPWRPEQLREQGRLGEALAAAQRSYGRDPSPGTGLALAQILDDVGQTAEARRILDLERGRSETDHDRVWIDAQLGFLCSTRGDAACSARALANLEGQTYEQSLAPFTRGLHLTFLGDLAGARQAYEEAMAHGRDFASLNNLAEVEACAGRLEESRKLYVDAFDMRQSPDAAASVLAGLSYTYLRDGDIAPAWLLASAAVVGTEGTAHESEPRSALALVALTGGDLAEARAQARLAQAANPYDDLIRRRTFAHPAEGAALKAVNAEARGDRTAAQAAWIEVARSGHLALQAVARRALAQLCP